MAVTIETGADIGRDALIRKLVDSQYERNDVDFSRGAFRVRGDTIEIFPAYEEDRAIRVELFGDTVEKISEFDPLRGMTLGVTEKSVVYPGSHYVTEAERRAMQTIRQELLERLQLLRQESKLLEAQRLEQRTMFDLDDRQAATATASRNTPGTLGARRASLRRLIDYFPRTSW
jgi:excinuclease ABC subunit B